MLESGCLGILMIEDIEGKGVDAYSPPIKRNAK